MNRKASLRLTGYVLFFICLTVVFSILNYPQKNLTAALNRQLSDISNGSLHVREVSLRPLLSLKLWGIAVDMREGRQVLGDAVVSPLLFPFLTGKKALRGKLDGHWATSRFKAGYQDGGWNLDVDSLKVKLDALPFPQVLPLELSGAVEANLELNVPDTSDIQMEGQGQITGTDIQASGELLEPLGLAPLRFLSLSVFFTIQDNVLTLNENNLTGDISASARGTVRLVPEQPGNSRLDLTVDIKPGAEAREHLAPVFSLLGVRQRANGRVILRIRGTIDRPSITS